MNSESPNRWLLLALSLAGRPGSTVRVRLWRAVRELGVATLRDGLSLLPATLEHRSAFEALAREAQTQGGTAWVLELLDRGPAYGGLIETLARLDRELAGVEEPAARRALRQAQRSLAEIERIDFFPGTQGERARAALAGLVAEIDRRFSPAEPRAQDGAIERLDASRFRARRWATRGRLWVDRVASAWLIRRFIDPQARFVWLDRPADCPADALGFDYDGAAFTHVGERVTFEVLAASFGLEADTGLARLGQLVHYLDAGGLPIAEAAGVEAMLAGLREATADDDALLAAATPMLDALYLTYSGPRA
jgi:hypothetical protein